MIKYLLIIITLLFILIPQSASAGTVTKQGYINNVYYNQVNNAYYLLIVNNDTGDGFIYTLLEGRNKNKTLLRQLQKCLQYKAVTVQYDTKDTNTLLDDEILHVTID